MLEAIRKTKRTTLNNSRNREGQAKKKKASLSKSEYLSEFRKSAGFGNIKLCIKCKKHVTDRMATEIKPDSPLYEEESLSSPTKKILRRLGKFWKCKSCDGIPNNTESSSIKLKIFRHNENENLIGPGEDRDDFEDADGQLEENGSTFVYMPCNVSAVKEFTQVNKVNSKLVSQIIYSGEKLSLSSIEILYQAQLRKYYAAKNCSDFYYGCISTIENKILSSLKPFNQESKIHGSDAWTKVQIEDVKWRFKQNGDNCLRIEISVPFQSDEVLGTILTQKGFVVSVRMETNSDGVFEKTYMVHTGKFYSLFLRVSVFKACLTVSAQQPGHCYIKGAEVDFYTFR